MGDSQDGRRAMIALSFFHLCFFCAEGKKHRRRGFDIGLKRVKEDKRQEGELREEKQLQYKGKKYATEKRLTTTRD